jgi:hypothetical protein
MSAVKLVLEYQTHQLGQSLLDQVRHVQTLKVEKQNEKDKKNSDLLSEIIAEGEAAIKRNEQNGVANIEKWNVKDITLLLRTYRKKNEKIPKSKKDVVDLFHQWKDRPTTRWNGRVVVNMLDEENIIVEHQPDVEEPLLPAVPVLEDVSMNDALVTVENQEVSETHLIGGKVEM